MHQRLFKEASIKTLFAKKICIPQCSKGKSTTGIMPQKCFGINWCKRRKTAAFSVRKKREDDVHVSDLVQTKVHVHVHVAQFYKSPQVSQKQTR